MTTDRELTRDERHDKWQAEREERARLNKIAVDAALAIHNSIAPSEPTYIGALYERFEELQRAQVDLSTYGKAQRRPRHIREVAEMAGEETVKLGLHHLMSARAVERLAESDPDAAGRLRDATFASMEPETELHGMVKDQLVHLFDNALAQRVLEEEEHHQVARITAALADAGASEECIEVAYGPRYGIVRVLRIPREDPNERVELYSGYHDKVSATGKYVGIVRFNHDSFDYSFLGTPRKSSRSWRSDGLRTTKNLATLVKLVAKQFYVPSGLLQSARVELADVDTRARYLSHKLSDASAKVTQVYDRSWDKARDVDLRDLIESAANEDTEVLDYLVRKQRTYTRFAALVEPILEEERARQAELHRIINREQSKGLNS